MLFFPEILSRAPCLGRSTVSLSRFDRCLLFQSFMSADKHDEVVKLFILRNLFCHWYWLYYFRIIRFNLVRWLRLILNSKGLTIFLRGRRLHYWAVRFAKLIWFRQRDSLCSLILLKLLSYFRWLFIIVNQFTLHYLIVLLHLISFFFPFRGGHLLFLLKFFLATSVTCIVIHESSRVIHCQFIIVGLMKARTLRMNRLLVSFRRIGLFCFFHRLSLHLIIFRRLLNNHRLRNKRE